MEWGPRVVKEWGPGVVNGVGTKGSEWSGNQG